MPLLCPGGGFIALFVKKKNPKQKWDQSFVILEVISQVRKVIETTDLESLTQALGGEHSSLKAVWGEGGRHRQKMN